MSEGELYPRECASVSAAGIMCAADIMSAGYKDTGG